ncbi:hypothetical protein [Mesorhizobium sp. M0571]|uniref:hypothetical protein n=1 Tax=Mesorhizobium sp. M0571 TaxID=2956960 RepID=UPI00333A1ED6
MVHEKVMAAALAARNQEADIRGVFDITNKTDAAIGPRRLGEAIHFVANAPIVGYDVHAAVIMYGPLGTPQPQSNRLRTAVGEVWRGPAATVTGRPLGRMGTTIVQDTSLVRTTWKPGG